MIEKSLVFRNVHVPGETHTYTVRVEVCIEFLNEDEDDDDEVDEDNDGYCEESIDELNDEMFVSKYS